MPEMTDAYQWQGRNMVDSEGEKIGKINQIYEDPATGKPEWATVSTGLFGTKSNFVPLAGASPDGEDVRARVTKDQVKDAPSIEDDGQLSEHEEQTLFSHYNVPYTTEGSTTAQGAPHTGDHAEGGTHSDRGTVGHDTSGPTTDGAMTRSEEELSHEEVTIEREPITDANRGDAMDGPEISEEEHEVVLHADEVVVDKDVIAKERVALGTQTVTDDQEVTEQVRREQIEIEGDTGTETRNR
jgi:uncharacterized protein (TIGR02271 family)